MPVSLLISRYFLYNIAKKQCREYLLFADFKPLATTLDQPHNQGLRHCVIRIVQLHCKKFTYSRAVNVVFIGNGTGGGQLAFGGILLPQRRNASYLGLLCQNYHDGPRKTNESAICQLKD